MASIHIVTTDGEELNFEIAQPKLTIGREADNDIVIPDASISSHHAELTESDGGYVLTDLNSTNGSQVNGARIDSSPISPGDTLVLGHASGSFVGETAATEAAAAPPPAGSAAAAPAERSQTPGGFANASPFTKKAKKKDPKGQALMAFGILGILACIAAIALSLVMTVA